MFDDIVAVELRAVAGAMYPLIDNTFTPDAPPGRSTTCVDTELPWNVSYLDAFPYLDHPVSGFDVRSLSADGRR